MFMVTQNHVIGNMLVIWIEFGCLFYKGIVGELLMGVLLFSVRFRMIMDRQWTCVFFI